jgi:hypothetical protein
MPATVTASRWAPADKATSGATAWRSTSAHKADVSHPAKTVIGAPGAGLASRLLKLETWARLETGL